MAMVGLEEVRGKQRTSLGTLSEFAPSKRCVRGGRLGSTESTSSPWVEGVRPAWQWGQPSVTWAGVWFSRWWQEGPG